MSRPLWKPIPYYSSSPLAKLPPVTNKLPHPLGYIPKYLRENRKVECVQ
jgi:hypothetical protein